MNPTVIFAVGLGGAIGALARFGISKVAMNILGTNFPWGTLLANISGSFMMGLIIVWLSKSEPHDAALRAFLTVGLLGAFTTFSTFSLDVVTLYRDRTVLIAAAYMGASVILAVAGLLLGMVLGRQII